MIERLQRAYNLARNTRASVVERYTAEEWLKIYDAYEACGWDYTPCRWSEEQRAAALLEIPPSW